MTPDWSFDRRTVLAALGTGTAVAVAGCLGGDDEADDDGTDSQDDGSEETGDDSSDTGDESQDDGASELAEPVAFPTDAQCPVCEMMPSEWPQWNTQLVHEDGTRTFFDTTGCMAAYVAATDRFGGPDSPVANAWVTEYESGDASGDLIDGMAASYVRVDNPSHVDDVMKMNPTPFADRADAEAFLQQLNEEYDADYDETEDIISFDAFDEELATFYRQKFLE